MYIIIKLSFIKHKIIYNKSYIEVQQIIEEEIPIQIVYTQQMNILLLLVIMLATITRQTMAFVSRSSFTQTLRVSSSQQQRSYSRTALSMKLQTAIVGLPNVGKSTLFNALTETQGAEAANYVSFCLRIL